jgi:hypothetical protein
MPNMPNHKEETLPLAPPEGESRTEARSVYKQKLHYANKSEKSTTSTADVDKDKIMTKTRYKNWKVMWDDYTPEEAFLEFDEVHAIQKGFHDTAEEDRVALEDIPEVVRKRKLSQSTSVDATEGIDCPTAKRLKKQMRESHLTKSSSFEGVEIECDDDIMPGDSASNVGSSFKG